MDRRKQRVYDAAIRQHFRENRQMLFLMGPRQVGKTTAAQASGYERKRIIYLNWDQPADRALILEGGGVIAEKKRLPRRRGANRPIIVFDEIHKASDWKNFLKGFFDVYGSRAHVLVTGSARLDVYQKGGDSLVGRYFRYRLHPFSVAELVDPVLQEREIRWPQPISKEGWEHLWRFGGFPEPLFRGTSRFLMQWKQLRDQQIFREDLRDLSRVQQIAQLEALAELIKLQAGQLSNYASFAKHLRASADSVRNWIAWLESVFYCFAVRPWHKNLSRSLIKEPKFYLYDWSQVANEGFRYENMMASHLLKACHFWTDYGLGTYRLFYLRTKEKREVDFIVVRDGKPWFLVEAKFSRNHGLSKHLQYFQDRTGAEHAFQVVREMDYQEVDCFGYNTPIMVPARTFLSQLV